MPDQSNKQSTAELRSRNLFQTLFFTWITPLLSRGSRATLQQEDIPEMQDQQQAHSQFVKLEELIRASDVGSDGMRVLRSAYLANRKHIYGIILIALFWTAFSMMMPNLTKIAIGYVEGDNKEMYKGILLVAGVLLLKFIHNIFQSHVFLNFMLLGLNISNSLSLCIFSKALRYPTLCSKRHQLSELINYSQVDAERLGGLGFNTCAALFFPLQLGIGIYLMYSFIGISFLAGIGVLLAMSILIFVNSSLQSKASTNLLSAKDKRMKTTTEIINNIRFIKSSAWERYFLQKVSTDRSAELSKLRIERIYGVMGTLFFWISSPLILSATFTAFMLKGELMTAEKAFTTIILFSILQFPISALPESVSSLIESWASIKRIGKFLSQPEIQRDYFTESTDPTNAVQIKNGNFYWELETTNKEEEKCDQTTTEETKSVTKSEGDLKESLLSGSDYAETKKETRLHALKHINLEVKKGSFTVILGDIGSGKSSLLYSILGQMNVDEKDSPRIGLNGSAVLVAQKAWIMSSSVEDNILMTLPKNEQRFFQAIHFSGLEEDLKQLTDGHKTMIGEKGVNLSGGQKARINLARAIYASPEIFLLDDVLSAVDAHVGSFLMKETLLDYLKGKTRILVTHAAAYAKHADYIVVMKKGEIVSHGSYESVKETPYFKEIEHLHSSHDAKQNEKQSGDKTKSLPTSLSLNRQSSSEANDLGVTDQLVDQLLIPEDKEKGQVSWATYKRYFKLSGGVFYIVVLILLFSAWTTLSSLASIQIERWCEDPSGDYVDLWTYVSFAVGSALVCSARSFLMVMISLRVSRKVHGAMFQRLIYASIPEFFDRVPSGRILNRFSKDLTEVDEHVSYQFGGVLVDVFLLVSNLVVCVYASTPLVLIPIILFLIVSRRLQVYFTKTQRECVRLESISKSPIVSGFSETMNGLPTVRSFGLQKQFIKRQAEVVNVNKRNQMAQRVVESWFVQRVAWLSYIVSASALIYCMLNQHSSGSMAGLLLAYSFNIDECVMFLVYSLADIESKMVSMERIAHFMDIEPEAGYRRLAQSDSSHETIDVPSNIVEKGEVRLENFTLCYRQGLPAVLHNLDFRVAAGEKIGIVGRTGAGKSTIISSLLRLVEPTNGAIYIDGRSIVDVDLRDLRSSITLIPQDPVLIEGTLKQNLDPRGEYTDIALFQVLSKCGLESVFAERQNLSTKISESGGNLSVGEKQLVCIARAILRNSRLVLVDEATANVDVKADQLIQKTIRECFREATVITIAHRINTILDCDRVIVLDSGRVAEAGPPNELLANKGHFFRLHSQTNNLQMTQIE